MADIYVRSTTGNDANSGATWALAKATVQGALSVAAAGDRVVVSQAHAQTQASALTLSPGGVAGDSIVIVCGNDSAQPPTSPAATAVIETTGSSPLTILGVSYVVKGLNFSSGTGTGNASVSISNSGSNRLGVFENCTFTVGSSSTNNRINIGTGANNACNKTVWRNCAASFFHVSHRFNIINAVFDWFGGSMLGGSTTPSLALFDMSTVGRGSAVRVAGVDLSQLGSSLTLFNFNGMPGLAQIRNCKLPASWSGALVVSDMGLGSRVEMHNCDSGDTNYRLWVEDHLGAIRDETTWVRDGGASDGTTSYSWRMASNANVHPLTPLESPEVAVWNDTVGTPITVSLEVLHDSATALTDAEAWIDVQYLGTSGFPLGNFADDRVASVFATPTNQPSSSETWTTTGMSNPNKQTLSVTFTPQEAGYLHCRVMLGKPSYTLVVDPKPVVS